MYMCNIDPEYIGQVIDIIEDFLTDRNIFVEPNNEVRISGDNYDWLANAIKDVVGRWSRKIYVVSYRKGKDMLMPDVFNSIEDANKAASDFLCSYAINSWEQTEIGNPPESKKELMEWAYNRGYVFTDSYFWDGSIWNGSIDDYEVIVSEYDSNIMPCNTRDNSN